MFDLTGNHLAGYMIRVVRDVVTRNPRFRSALGEVAAQSNYMVSYGDVQCIVKDITAQGARLSPDNFMCFQLGRSIVATVGDKDGSFIEWANEIDPTLATPVAGIYMMGVAGVDEKTRDVFLETETYKWYEGYVKNAQGSRVNFAPGIDATTVQPYDITNNNVPEFQAGADFIYLLSSVVELGVKDVNNNVLTPLTQYWVDQTQSQVIIESTVFGTQTAQVPSNYDTVTLVDQDGFTLRNGIDYIFTSATTVTLSGWTPAGGTITAVGTVKADPSIAGNCLNPENTLDFTLAPGETLVADQVSVCTQAGDDQPVTVSTTGVVTLDTPLPPGGWCRYNIRTLVGFSRVTAKKIALNTGLVPGMSIAIGDSVTVGDQCALIVSPQVCQTYEVYGSKDNVNFTIDVKANDPSTASELAELLKQELLINRRARIEADGISILEASRAPVVNQRDRSATATGWVSTLGVSCLADWRVFKPLVTRVQSVDITTSPTTQGYPGKPSLAPRMFAIGAIGFLPDYR